MRIEFNNGVLFEIGDLYRLRNLVISDIESTNHFEFASGSMHSHYYGTDYEQRTITIEFETRFSGTDEFEDKQSEILKLFNFGVGTLEYNDLEMEVIKTGNVEIERVYNSKMVVTVSFVNIGLPYFKSKNKIVSYDENGAFQNVQNTSDVTLDPRYTDIELKFTLDADVSFFQITDSLGNALRINRSMSVGDVIIIAGGTTYLNDEDILEDTSMEIIQLPPGTSRLDILGTTQYTFELSYTVLKF